MTEGFCLFNFITNRKIVELRKAERGKYQDQGRRIFWQNVQRKTAICGRKEMGTDGSERSFRSRSPRDYYSRDQRLL